MTVTTARDLLLSATDRCDACGARAYVFAVLRSGRELLFCAHHARRHHAALKVQTLHLHDESPSGPTSAEAALQR